MNGPSTTLGFANFYRRFIKGPPHIVAPTVCLTKKGIVFQLNDICEKAFQDLKIAFTSAPILHHFDPDRKVIIETDAADYVPTGILSRCSGDGVLHPSLRNTPTECNYDIYDKELFIPLRNGG